jgi:disulfide oxidoreductase YuzD
VVDPAPIFESVERLSKKGGREAIARCPSMEDAQAAAEWLLDRISRLAPNTNFKTEITPGGGQFLLKLSTT